MNTATLCMIDAEIGRASFKSTVEIVAMEHNTTAAKIVAEYDAWRVERAEAARRRSFVNGTLGRSVSDL